MSIQYAVQKHLDNLIIIDAREDSKLLGLYKIELEPKPSGLLVGSSVIFSAEHGKGIPRGLIAEAVACLSKRASANCKTIEHNVCLDNPDSAMKLSHIYEEFGYMPALNICAQFEYLDQGITHISTRYRRIYN